VSVSGKEKAQVCLGKYSVSAPSGAAVWQYAWRK